MRTVQELASHIRDHLHLDSAGISGHLSEMRPADIVELLNALRLTEAAPVLEMLPDPIAIRVCDDPGLTRLGRILGQLPVDRATAILTGMAADQRTDAIQAMIPHDRARLMPKLDAASRAEVEQLTKYPDDTAGGIMTTEFVRLEPSMTVARSLEVIRRIAADRESIYACYVVDPSTERLLGAVSLRDLVMAQPDQPIADVMRKNPLSINVTANRLDAARKISKYNLLALPVTEADGRLVGFITVDDIVDVLIDEQTDQVLRMGAVEAGALDDPYLATPFVTLVRKRAVWLVILFLSEMLTATAMGFFEGQIAKAVVLALFVPLIISSGGNSGSQAASLIIRALALREISLGDWWRVMRREIYSGLMLGGLLGVIGFLRIAVWTLFSDIYGPHWPLIGLTVGLSLVGIVMWGTLTGAMLPFILKKLGADPATSSAPFVATLVDVTGLVIYFTVAMFVLHGTLL